MWPFSSRREDRAQDYTSLITTALDDAASSTTGEGVIAARTGALELCAGQWGRALSTAAVEPAGVRSVVTSSVLALIGRELCRRGEAVFLLNLESGAMRLVPAGWHQVFGSEDPSTWVYSATVQGPTASRTVWRQAGDVVHVRYAVDAIGRRIVSVRTFRLRASRKLSPRTRALTSSTARGSRRS